MIPAVLEEVHALPVFKSSVSCTLINICCGCCVVQILFQFKIIVQSSLLLFCKTQMIYPYGIQRETKIKTGLQLITQEK